MRARLFPDRKTLFLLIGFLLSVSLPVLLAALSAAPAGLVFGGFLINVQDGYSYLGKLRQGLDGAWLFRPDYTLESSAGALINLPYLLIGQLARIDGPLIAWLHAVRLLGAAALFFALRALIWRVIDEDDDRWRALWLALFGSGMGWLLAGAGVLTSDFWVSEAYPWLASYTNLHFPLGLVLQIILLILHDTQNSWRYWCAYALGGMALGLVSAFSVPVVLAVWGGVFLWELRAREDVWPTVKRGAAIALGGGLVLVYDYWAILCDPVLADWNARNLTPSPPLWELALVFSPAVLAALIGQLRSGRTVERRDRALIVWLLLIPLLVYLPFPLQRRFLVGYFIPAAVLAVKGLSAWLPAARQRLGWRVLFALSIPTNLLVLATGFAAAASHPPIAYFTQEEAAAFAWMASNLPEDAGVLAAPETGLMLPGLTGARVLYGHPFESYGGEANRAAVEAAYITGDVSVLADQPALAYVYVGPRERALCGGDCVFSGLDGLHVAYEQGGVILYQVQR